MTTRPPLPMPPPSPEQFEPEKFKKKTNIRDYAIYALVLVVVLGVVGGAVYFFTRSKPEQEELRAKLDRTLNDARLGGEKEAEGKTREEELAVTKVPMVTKTPQPKAVGVSTYSGGGPNRIQASDRPDLPKAGAAFIQFVESLKISGVVQGNPSRMIIAGKMYREGAVIDPELNVTFAAVDGDKKLILLRDGTGAELRLSY